MKLIDRFISFKITTSLAFLLTFASFVLKVGAERSVYAVKTFTPEEVAKHSKTTDCYMSFEGKVYDFTSYLRAHDRYMIIDSWCGKDITEDFKDKAGLGRDHKASSYSMLTNYEIGILSSSSSTTNTPSITKTEEEHDEEYSVEISGRDLKLLTIKEVADKWGIDATKLLTETVRYFKLSGNYTINSKIDDLRSEYKFSPSQIKEIAESLKSGNNANTKETAPPPYTSTNPETSTTVVRVRNPYNLVIPLFSTAILYFAHYFAVKKAAANRSKDKKTNRLLTLIGFNAVWNTLLLISLIPSFVFGIYMTLWYSFPAMRNVKFDFMYWHVEGSVVMGTIAVSHLIIRLNTYFMQLKNVKG